ncbi:disintegrin and metalloproteinase domain-containing protein 5-like [Myotis daubentonii]|uniref:disintegrin and metalloproteinase domain-containing protein 5-like n=1 Tax=Myotis daubentonii TaxID=98922 RepID=UPI002873DAA8|nr:disintegrin and metalloproteinase domain-containing protein 5-like [Myotis daubentonii]
MFSLLVLFMGLAGLQAGLNHHKTFLQSTVPEKISSTDTERDPENNVAYMITIKEKPYFVHLKKQSFLSPVSVVYSYDKYDTQKTNNPFDQMDCSYYGYIAGIPNSLVSLSTCSGLRGILQLKNISYGIEPMEVASGFMHMIYEDKNYHTNISLLGISDIYNSNYQYRKSSERVEFFKLIPQYLELYIVVDKNMFDYMGSDIKAVTQKVIQIFGLVNTMFSQLKLTVVISSIEIWSNKNKISTFGNPYSILYRFLQWKSEHVFQPAYLLVFKKQIHFKGAVLPGKICYKNEDAGVALQVEGSSLESYAVSIVQLLSLHMGLSFDNTDTCYCSGDVCTMSPEAMHSRGVKDFSTCSLDEFKHFASNSSLECLRNSLPIKPVYKRKKFVCGNGILEKGEQCDCGLAKNCTHKKCCDPTSCRFKGRVVCGSGECCTQSCKLKPGGNICRKQYDEDCDFLEYCNGIDPHCVPDTFKRDGEYCNGNESFCYKGQCRMFDKQCRDLIGGAARGGQFACYDEINSRGDRYGNCGKNYCSFPHVMCGKLVCAWPHKAIVSKANLSVIYTQIRNEICVSTFLSSDRIPANDITTVNTPEDRDKTFTEDGTSCGPDMYCINFTCREIRHMVDYSACNNTRDCNDKGICNNFQHCHCDKGFAPPYCKPQKNAFGSQDDGHIYAGGKNSLAQRSASSKRRIQLIFYISLPMFVIIAAVLIKQDKIRDLCYRGETGSERSVSVEDSINSKLSSTVRLNDKGNSP